MPEVAEEKQGQQQPSPPPSAPAGKKRDLFPLLSRVALVLMGLAWGATAAHLLTRTGWLGAATVRLANWALTPGAIVVGAALAAGIAFLGLRKFGPRMVYYKPGQATGVRLTAYLSVFAVTVFGAYSFYRLPPTTSSWWANIAHVELAGVTFGLKPILFPTVGIVLTVMLVAFLLMNREKWGDFLIETEGELKKVAWPARKEYLGSSVVVILVIVVISVFLHVVDIGLSKLMEKLGIGF